MQQLYGHRRPPHPKPLFRSGLFRLLFCAFLFTAAVIGKRVLPAEFREALITGPDSGMNCREFIETVGTSITSREAWQALREKGILEVFGLRTKTAATEVSRDEEPDTEVLSTPGTDLLAHPVIPVIQVSETRIDAEPPQEEIPTEEETSVEPDPAAQDTAESAVGAPRTDENGHILPDIVSLEAVALPFSVVTPVYGVLTSDFGYREHPIDGEFKFHYGVDLAAPTGTDVGCFADGIVSFAGWGDINGYYIRVTHEDGVETLYAHLSEILVRQGDAVTAGDVIGRVGETGEASGPHLHFQVYCDGILVDPLQYIEYML